MSLHQFFVPHKETWAQVMLTVSRRLGLDIRISSIIECWTHVHRRRKIHIVCIISKMFQDCGWTITKTFFVKACLMNLMEGFPFSSFALLGVVKTLMGQKTSSQQKGNSLTFLSSLSSPPNGSYPLFGKVFPPLLSPPSLGAISSALRLTYFFKSNSQAKGAIFRRYSV